MASTMAYIAHVDRHTTALHDLLRKSLRPTIGVTGRGLPLCLLEGHGVRVEHVEAGAALEWCGRRLGVPVASSEHEGLFVVHLNDMAGRLGPADRLLRPTAS